MTAKVERRQNKTTNTTNLTNQDGSLDYRAIVPETCPRRNRAALAGERGDRDEAANLWCAVLAECPNDREARDHLDSSAPDATHVRTSIDRRRKDEEC